MNLRIKKEMFLSMNNDLMTIIYLKPMDKSLDILFIFFLSLFIIYLLSDILVFSFLLSMNQFCLTSCEKNDTRGR